MTKTKTKAIPDSKPNEMMVLGCMLTSISNLKVAVDSLKEEDFNHNEHRLIFNAMSTLCKQNKPADVHLVSEELKRTDKLKEVGGISYVMTLAQYAGTSAHIEEYVEILKGYSFRRSTLKLCEQMHSELLEGRKSPTETAETYYRAINNLRKRHSTNGAASIGDILSGSKSSIDQPPLIDRLQVRQKVFKETGKSFMTGIPTGFSELDKQVTLLEDTHLIVLAARPGMGKTALALNIASEICLEQNYPVAFITLEMGRDQLVERLVAAKAGISGEKIKRGTFNDAEFKKIKEAMEAFNDAKFFIDDRNCHTIDEVVSKARNLKDGKNIRLLVIDYLQLLGAAGDFGNRQYEVGEVSRRLKLLAGELRIPVLCVAQLSRKVEERQSKIPQLSDLRDSGQIEQDADVVAFILRREYYDKNDKPGQAEFIVAKNRHGPAPTVNLSFQADIGRFANLEPLPSPGNYTVNTQYRSEGQFVSNLKDD